MKYTEGTSGKQQPGRTTEVLFKPAGLKRKPEVETGVGNRKGCKRQQVRFLQVHMQQKEDREKCNLTFQWARDLGINDAEKT